MRPPQRSKPWRTITLVPRRSIERPAPIGSPSLTAAAEGAGAEADDRGGSPALQPATAKASSESFSRLEVERAICARPFLGRRRLDDVEDDGGDAGGGG